MPATKEAGLRRDFNRDPWEIESEHFLVRTILFQIESLFPACNGISYGLPDTFNTGEGSSSFSKNGFNGTEGSLQFAHTHRPDQPEAVQNHITFRLRHKCCLTHKPFWWQRSKFCSVENAAFVQHNNLCAQRTVSP